MKYLIELSHYFQKIVITLLISSVFFSCSSNSLDPKELLIVEKAFIGEWSRKLFEEPTMTIYKKNGKLVFEDTENNFIEGTIDLSKEFQDGDAYLKYEFINSETGKRFFRGSVGSYKSMDSVFINLKEGVDLENQIKEQNLKSNIFWGYFYFLYTVKYSSWSEDHYRYYNCDYKLTSLNKKYKVMTNLDNEKPDGSKIFSLWKYLDNKSVPKYINRLLNSRWRITDSNNPKVIEFLNKTLSFEFIKEGLIDQGQSKYMKKMYNSSMSDDNIKIPVDNSNLLYSILKNFDNSGTISLGELSFNISRHNPTNRYGILTQVNNEFMFWFPGIGEINIYSIKIPERNDYKLSMINPNSIILADKWSYICITPVE